MILSVAIINQNGKPLVARQFSKVSKAQILNQLGVFPKLLTKTSQSYVESQNIRYVYQDLDKLYFILITTKDSNILEDLELLSMLIDLTRTIIPTIDETTVLSHNLDLIFAYDEVIFDGYRQTVSVNDVSEFLLMDSKEELQYLEELQKKEDEAKKFAAETQKILDKQKKSKTYSSASSVSYTPSEAASQSVSFTQFTSYEPEIDVEDEPTKSSSIPNVPRKQASNVKGMTLGKSRSAREKAKQVILEEGLHPTSSKADAPVSAPTPLITEGLLFEFEESFSGSLNYESDGKFTCYGYLYGLGRNAGKYTIQVNWDNSFTAYKNPVKNTKQLSFDNTKPSSQRTEIVKYINTNCRKENLPIELLVWPTDPQSSKSKATLQLQVSKNSDSTQNVGQVKIRIKVLDPSSATITLDQDSGEYEVEGNEVVWTTPDISEEDSFTLEIAAMQTVADFFDIEIFFNAECLYSNIDITNVFKEGEEDNPVEYKVNKKFTSGETTHFMIKY